MAISGGKSTNIKVGLDTKDIATGVQRIQGELTKITGTVKSLGSTFKGLGVAILGAQGIANLSTFLQGSVQKASDLNETISKTKVIFGDASTAIFKFADTAVYTLGQTQQQAMDAASSFAVFGKSAGLANDDLTTFSTDLVKLSADLASFYNTSPEDAILAIGAALRGESEPIRKYGVLLDDASLRQKALEMGIISTTKNALKPQERVLAAQKLIFEQTTDAQGDFERTSSGLANTTRKLKAQMSELATTIGSKLVPAIETMAGNLSTLFESINTNGIKSTTLYYTKLLSLKGLMSSNVWAQNPLVKTLSALGFGLAGTYSAITGDKPLAGGGTQKTSPSLIQTVKPTTIGSAFKPLSDEQLKELEKIKKAREDAERKRKDALIDKIEGRQAYVENQAALNDLIKDVKVLQEEELRKLSEIPVLLPITFEPQFTEPMGKLKHEFVKFTKDLGELQEQVNNNIDAFIKDSVVGLFDALGQELGGNAKAIDDWGKQMIAGFGGFLQKMGAMIIAYGFAMDAFKKAWKNPYVAIAAGAALIAIGGAIKAAHNKKMGAANPSGGSNGDTGFSNGYNNNDMYIYSRLDGRDLVLSNQRSQYQVRR